MLIIGAKGHAKEILDILYKNSDTEDLCFYDDITKGGDTLLYDRFPILTSLKEAMSYFKNRDSRFHLGIGDPVLRQGLFQKFSDLGGKCATIISNRADLGNFEVSIGTGCTIAPWAIINNSVTIDIGVLVNRSVSIGHDCTIGKFVEFCPNVIVSGNCEIGDSSFLGTGAIVLPKIKIGRNVVVAAGAVVAADVPDSTMVAGIPAIKKAKRDEEG